jgi:Sensors of blue-light using FAD
MHKLLYVSATQRSLPQSELDAILNVARIKNSALGVTGLLLYADGGFLQVLEGERGALHQLYSVIAKDARHWEARLLLDEECDRNFSAWSMGFKRLEGEDADPAVVGLTQSAIAGLIKPGGAKPVLDVLIRTFQSVHGAS